MTDERHLAIRRLLLPKDTNHRGEIFGGAILSELDLAGAVEARRHTHNDVATVAMKEVVFKKPVRVGDVVSFWTTVVKIGTTSIHVRVEMTANRDGTGDEESVTAAELVYVAVEKDENGDYHKTLVKPTIDPTCFRIIETKRNEMKGTPACPDTKAR